MSDLVRGAISKARHIRYQMWVLRKENLHHKIATLKNEHLSNLEIAKALGISESTVRSLWEENKAVAFVNETTPLERELSELLNRHSAENESNTPDFILARYLMSCLHAYNDATNRRAEFHKGGVLNVD